MTLATVLFLSAPMVIALAIAIIRADRRDRIKSARYEEYESRD